VAELEMAEPRGLGAVLQVAQRLRNQYRRNTDLPAASLPPNDVPTAALPFNDVRVRAAQ
jgi:hypothetical protein